MSKDVVVVIYIHIYICKTRSMKHGGGIEEGRGFGDGCKENLTFGVSIG